MNNILSSSQLNLAAFANNLASQHHLDITKIYCRKTGKLIGHRTNEEIELLQKLFSTCSTLTDKLNLCDSVSPAFVKIQTETLNILEEEDPVSLFVFYLNLLTRQFNETITTKGARTFVSTMQENKFKNSLVLAHQFVEEFVNKSGEPLGASHTPGLDTLNLENFRIDLNNDNSINSNLAKLKDCNNKLRWLLTLNLPIKRFYVIDITNALDAVTISEKSRAKKEVEWLKRNNLSRTTERRTIKEAVIRAKHLKKIVEFIFNKAEYANHFKTSDMAGMADFTVYSDGYALRTSEQITDPIAGSIIRNMDAAFYDPHTDKVYGSVDNIPNIIATTARDFNENSILPHELATSKGIDWIINYFPKAFAKCKDHLLRNTQNGWHAYDGINKVFGRGNKTDEYSNDFVEFLQSTQRMFVATRTRKEFNKTKNEVLAKQRNVQPLTIESLDFSVENVVSLQPKQSLTFSMKPAIVSDGKKIVFELKKQD